MKQPSIRAFALLALGAAGTLMAALPARAKFANLGEPVPIPRLLRNTEERLKKSPQDAEAHYLMGRLHSLAFAVGTNSTSTGTKGEGQPIFPPYNSILTPRPEDKPDEARLAHLRASLAQYGEATRLAPKNALYWLGLGWMHEQSLPYSDKLEAKPQPRAPAFAKAARASLEAYRTAYRLTRESDLKLTNLGPGADGSIALEAGEGLMRLLEGARKPNEKAEAEEISRTVAELKKKPRVVTPIILPLGARRDLAGLLSAGGSTVFDLAGDTRPERWPWLAADTGILVWDPARTGRITSGRQLFGSATWSMIWKNGYEPLAALDDNHDGRLEGAELAGIAIWQDRNGNGRSEPGEVMPVESRGIRCISTRASSLAGGAPCSLRGVQFADGTWLPTYDWTPTSIAPSAGRATPAGFRR